MTKFEEGQLVYYPKIGTQVYDVRKSYALGFPIRVGRMVLTEDGKDEKSDTLASIFLATKENREALEKLYGISFDSFENFDADSSIAFAKLAEWSILPNRAILCYVSNKPKNEREDLLIPRIIISAHMDKSFNPVYNFVDNEGGNWLYAKFVSLVDLSTINK